MILITSALLLTAENPSAKPSPIPSPRDAKADSEKSNLIQQPAEQHQTPAEVRRDPINAPAQKTGSDDQENQTDLNSVLLTAFTAIMAVATIALVFFTSRLVNVTKELNKITAIAADATKKSAEVAELTLRSDRPFLIAEEADLIRTANTTARIFFRNRGKGPAIIADIRMEMVLATAGSVPRSSYYSEATNRRILEPVLGPGEQSSAYDVWCDEVNPIHTGSGDIDSYTPLQQIFAQDKRMLILFGCVRYHDTSNDLHESGFCWEYWPPLRSFYLSDSYQT